MTFADDQALRRLMDEMKQIGRSPRGKRLGEYQVIEQASARLGMYPSYAYRLLFKEISVTPGGSPVFTRDIGTQEIYALSVKWP